MAQAIFVQPADISSLLRKKLQQARLLSGYKVDGALALHIINLADTIPEELCKVAHGDEIKNFTPDGVKLPESTLKIKMDEGMNPQTAVMRTPETDVEIPLEMKLSHGAATITLPANVFSGYGLVTVELKH